MDNNPWKPEITEALNCRHPDNARLAPSKFTQIDKFDATSANQSSLQFSVHWVSNNKSSTSDYSWLPAKKWTWSKYRNSAYLNFDSN